MLELLPVAAIPEVVSHQSTTIYTVVTLQITCMSGVSQPHDVQDVKRPGTGGACGDTTAAAKIAAHHRERRVGPALRPQHPLRGHGVGETRGGGQGKRDSNTAARSNMVTVTRAEVVADTPKPATPATVETTARVLDLSQNGYGVICNYIGGLPD